MFGSEIYFQLWIFYLTIQIDVSIMKMDTGIIFKIIRLKIYYLNLEIDALILKYFIGHHFFNI
jgi:hypothetical protein